jgi:hypothetical protein
VIPSAPAGPVILKSSEETRKSNPRIPARAQSSKAWPIPEEVARRWWPRQEHRTPCTPRFWSKFCKHEVKKVPIGCGRVWCRRCERKNRKRRAVRIHAKIQAVRENAPVIYIVPTVPEQRRHLAASARTWQSWRKKLVDWLRKKLGFKYLHERTDPAGKCREANRAGEPCSCVRCQKWHPHMNILAVAAGSACPNGVLSREQLAALKAEWARIIGWESNVDVRVDNSAWNRREKRNCTPAEEDWKIGKWCSYQGRVWPDWQGSVRKHMVPRWYGKKVVVPKPERKPEACAVCGAEYAWLECRAGEDEADFWCSMGPEKCADELVARLNPETGWMEYRPVPESLLRGDTS